MHKDLIKSAITLIVSAGIGAVVTNAVKATTPVDLTMINKIAVMIGTVGAAHAISDVAAKYTSEQIDEIGEAAHKIKTAIRPEKD